MIAVRLSELALILNGQLLGDDCEIKSVSTDSRKQQDASLFVALMGERFDAHDFVQTAAQQGAVACLVSRPVETMQPQLIVKDTRIALGQLAAWVRSKSQAKTIALTGSCGKTTVKEMLAKILQSVGPTLFTAGNLNNDIGVPLTLLRLELSDEFSVIELGANHIGEIAYTTQLVRPDIALVTNLAAAHLEGFGSMAGVTQAKGEIFEGLSAGGVAIVNLDSWGDGAWSALLEDKLCVTISVSNTFADFYAKDIRLNTDGCYQFQVVSPQGEFSIRLSLPGIHHISNALLAIAAAMQCEGVSLMHIQQGLSLVAPVKGRGAISFPKPGWRVIDDSYNASLAAMKSAIDLLNTFEGDKLIILADMAEMGVHEQDVHHAVATHLAQSNIQTVITYGSASEVISTYCAGLHFDDKDALNAHVVELMKTKHQVSVLVKGANGMKMWEVVQAIEEAAKC